MRMKKSIMDIITENATNERLDAILNQDKMFAGLQEKIDRTIEVFNGLNLTKEQRRAVDRMVSAHTESGAYYSAMAYRQGFKDCAELMAEIFTGSDEGIRENELF